MERFMKAPPVGWEVREGLLEGLMEALLDLVRENVREEVLLNMGEGIAPIQSRGRLVR